MFDSIDYIFNTSSSISYPNCPVVETLGPLC